MVAEKETMAVDTKVCPDCGQVMTKAHNNDPLGDSVKYKCTNSECGSVHEIYQ